LYLKNTIFNDIIKQSESIDGPIDLDLHKLQLTKNLAIDFVNKIIEEFVQDNIQFKEIIQENNYYECDEIFGINIIMKIKEYFDNYNEEEIIKAYLYDMYNIGDKILSSKLIITDKNKYGYSRTNIHKRIMEIIDDTDEESEIITEDLKKLLNKNKIIIKKESVKNKTSKGLFVDTSFL
jgi:hypothetical protein